MLSNKRMRGERRKNGFSSQHLTYFNIFFVNRAPLLYGAIPINDVTRLGEGFKNCESLSQGEGGVHLIYLS